MDFKQLSRASAARQAEWPGAQYASIAFRALEIAGEAGELAEAVKKYLRAERGIKGATATITDIADEMADVIIAIDLLAADLGIPLGEAVQSKFNKTSDKYGLKTRL